MVDSIFKDRLYFRKFPHKVALRIIRDIRLYNGWGFDCDDVIDGNNYIEYLYGILASLAKNDCYGDFEYDRLVIELKLLDYSVVYGNGISRVITWTFPRIYIRMVYDGIEFEDIYDMAKDEFGGEYERIRDYLV